MHGDLFIFLRRAPGDIKALRKRKAGRVTEEQTGSKGGDVHTTAPPELSGAESVGINVGGGSSLRHRNPPSAALSECGHVGQARTISRGGSLRLPGSQALTSCSSGPLPEITLSRSQSLAHRQAEAAELMHVIDGDWGGATLTRSSLRRSSAGRASSEQDAAQAGGADDRVSARKSAHTRNLSIVNEVSNVSNMEAGLVKGEFLPEAGVDETGPKAAQASQIDEEVEVRDICVDLDWDAGEDRMVVAFRHLFSQFCSLPFCCCIPL